MEKWVPIIYKNLKSFYTGYTFFLLIGIGTFALTYDYKTLKRKKLSKEAVICKYIGWTYLVAGIGLCIFFKIV